MKYRIQTHLDRELWQEIEAAAKAKGISINNEVRERLGASLQNDNPDLLVKNVEAVLREFNPTLDWSDVARAIVSMIPPDRLPEPKPLKKHNN